MEILKNGVAVVVCLAISISHADERADADWQQAMLFQPDSAQLQREKAGRVMIYQGVTDKVIDQAMDEQFGRVSSMMFVGTVITDVDGEPLKDEETGELVVEDDGC